MKKDDVFESERLLFRGIQEEDAPVLVRWRSDPEAIKFFRNPRPLTLGGHLNWFSRHYLPDRSRFDFLVLTKAGSIPIGTVGVQSLSLQDGTCELSYMIAERDHQRKGYAKESILAIIRRLETEEIHFFRAIIHRENVASIRTVDSLGFYRFSQEGGFETYAFSSTP